MDVKITHEGASNDEMDYDLMITVYDSPMPAANANPPKSVLLSEGDSVIVTDIPRKSVNFTAVSLDKVF